MSAREPEGDRVGGDERAADTGMAGEGVADPGVAADTGTAGLGASDDVRVPLVGEADDLRRSWERIQGGFVDEPRRAVEQADALVDEVIRGIVDSFASERRALEERWAGGGDVSTEDLRVALQRYRSFFDRLLRT